MWASLGDSRSSSRLARAGARAPLLSSTGRGALLAVAMTLMSSCGGAPGRNGEGEADLVLVGGAIMTMDAQRPRVTAVAVRGERIVAVGADADMRAWIGPETRVVQLRGRSVTPGLTDTHAHLSGLGADLESVSLRGRPARARRRSGLRPRRRSCRPASGSRGRGWDQNLWADKKFPTRDVLDQAVRRPAGGAAADRWPRAVGVEQGRWPWPGSTARRRTRRAAASCAMAAATPPEC